MRGQEFPFPFSRNKEKFGGHQGQSVHHMKQ